MSAIGCWIWDVSGDQLLRRVLHFSGLTLVSSLGPGRRGLCGCSADLRRPQAVLLVLCVAIQPCGRHPSFLFARFPECLFQIIFHLLLQALGTRVVSPSRTDVTWGGAARPWTRTSAGVAGLWKNGSPL